MRDKVKLLEEVRELVFPLTTNKFLTTDFLISLIVRKWMLPRHPSNQHSKNWQKGFKIY